MSQADWEWNEAERAARMGRKRAEFGGERAWNRAAVVAMLEGRFEDAEVLSRPGGIEAQEKYGQHVVNEIDILPRDAGENGWEYLKQLGFEIVKLHDELFYEARMPAGWRKQATEHSMHTDLIDPQGRKRGGIFYKAASYDRRADMHLLQRYSAYSGHEGGYADGYESRPERGFVEDRATGQIIWQSEESVMRPDFRTLPPGSGESYFDTKDCLNKAAKAWLAEHYPRHQDPTAYWDDPA